MDDPVAVKSEVTGTIVSLVVEVGDSVATDSVLALIESMKLHHELRSPVAGTVHSLPVGVGDTVAVGDTIVELAVIDASSDDASSDDASSDNGLGAVGDRVQLEPTTPGPGDSERADLAEVVERHRVGLDSARPDAVAKRRAKNRRTVRENVAALIDDDSFVEYGPLAIAAQRSRRSHDDLVHSTPADGLVAGIGTVSGRWLPTPISVAVAGYDYTVLAGTQGYRNHLKKDKLFDVAAELGLPVVLFSEGGGGRPGDTDTGGATGLDSLAFGLLAELSGAVPLVAINAGYCFAGNAALLGVCDVVIATRDSNIGMAGPAMIEGGGLGVFAPTDIGPIEVQARNGVVDVVVDDEPAAVEVAKQYLGYFQGAIQEYSASDGESLRHLVPQDRLRAYQMRDVVLALFDTDSVLELRRDFGPGMITALARVHGRPVGVIANNPSHLAGAIDSDGADKAARFMQLCDAHGLPIISLVDTPGMMVGPEVEATGLVRHCSRLFVHGANLTVPMISVVTRKAYGLGAQAMMGGSTKAPLATLAWPTGEFGPMGLEGAVHLGYRAELAACADESERAALFDRLVDALYQKGKALSIAEYFEIDDVIDPADTRRWLVRLLDAAPRRKATRPHIDTW